MLRGARLTTETFLTACDNNSRLSVLLTSESICSRTLQNSHHGCTLSCDLVQGNVPEMWKLTFVKSDDETNL